MPVVARTIPARLARPLVFFVLVALLAAPAAAQEPMSWSEFRALDRVEADAREVWGEGEDAFGEVYLPEGEGPHPVVVLVHGGCWQSIAGVGYVSHLARRIAQEGWAVWSPEFRRIDQPGGSWPGILEDVGRATDHLRALAPRHDLDLERVVAMGHSSGGHLALWLAARPKLDPLDPVARALRGDDPLAPVGVVGLAAIADLDDFHRAEGGGCGARSVERLLDAAPESWHDRLALSSPTGALPLGVPQLMVTGALDATVASAHAEHWAGLARAAGDPVEVVIPEGAGHFEVVAPWASTFAPAWREIADFLRRTEPR
ncbi:alpha/beta hydrolase [Gemmatimonadota bacterium Y43]|uniref:alpha/beta hydrolase n=1 Tax=Gaopeijia maritima TaxID=3119007 RepID=UPI00327D4F4C